MPVRSLRPDERVIPAGPTAPVVPRPEPEPDPTKTEIAPPIASGGYTPIADVRPPIASGGYKPRIRALGKNETVIPLDGAEAEADPGLVDKMLARVMGDDIGREDPQGVPRALSTMGAGMTGAAWGARVPLLPGPWGIVVNPVTGALAGGAIGSVLGALSPEVAMEGAEATGWKPEGYREQYGLSNEELRVVAEGEALVDFVTGGVFQVAGQGARVTSRLLSGIPKESAELAERAARMGVDLPTAAVGTRTFPKFFTSVFGRFPMIGTPTRKIGEKAEKQIITISDTLSDRVAPLYSETDIGQMIYKDARTLVEKTAKHFSDRYTALFDAADAANVKVTPKETLAKAQELLAKIAGETPTMMTGPGSPGPVLEKIKTFITEQILPMRAQMDGGVAVSKQTLRQMDGLVSKIDQEISSLEPGQKRYAASLLHQLKIAAEKDGVTNLSGDNAKKIGEALRALGQEFSLTHASLFETATAKRFTRVRRKGIRGMTADEATQVPVDQLAKTVVILDSPQAIEELSRIVTPGTMQKIAAKAIDDALKKGVVAGPGGAELFHPDAVIKHLGLNRRASGRADAFGKLMENTTGLTKQDIKTVLDAAKAMQGFEIPNSSSLIARRAGIGGIRSALRGMLPGVAIAGAAQKGGGILRALVGMVLFAGGFRGMSALLADPLAARPLRSILGEMTRRGVGRTTLGPSGRANAIRAWRGVITALNRDGDIPDGMKESLMEMGRDALGKVAQTISGIQGKEE